MKTTIKLSTPYEPEHREYISDDGDRCAHLTIAKGDRAKRFIVQPFNLVYSEFFGKKTKESIIQSKSLFGRREQGSALKKRFYTEDGALTYIEGFLRAKAVTP